MSSPDPTAAAPRHPTAFGQFFDKAGMLLVLALLFIGCSLFVDNFFSWANMKGLALAVSMTGMVACTMLFCLAAGDFDLSIGSVVACAGVIAIALISGQLRGIPLFWRLIDCSFGIFGAIPLFYCLHLIRRMENRFRL